VTEIIIGDAARNWYLVATIVASASLMFALGRGTYLRKALVDLMVGVPASLWMLATHSGVTAGGSMPLLFAIALLFGHIAVAIANLIAAGTRPAATRTPQPLPLRKIK